MPISASMGCISSSVMYRSRVVWWACRLSKIA
jgi:hypothetical protein